MIESGSEGQVAITIASGRITSIQAMTHAPPKVTGGQAVFNPGQVARMHAEGTVTFNGSAGDNGDGWIVGWIQAQWIETNWGWYRGRAERDGSIFLQKGRAPARTRQACRDTSGPVADIFTDPTDPKEFQRVSRRPAFPLRVNVQTNDPPGEAYNVFEPNSLTHARNFLDEIQIEFHFCTVLTVRDPAGAFHHQAHFYWNIHWQYRFDPTVFPNPADTQWRATGVTGRLNNTTNVSQAFSGAPADRRFDGFLTTPQTISCVGMAGQATNAVATVGNPCRRESVHQNMVDVRQ
jgi:hypothetical protein